MVDCVNTNIGSEKTILALGGVFDREVHEDNQNVILKNYWINVDESLEKYKDLYEEYVITGIIK